MKATTIEVRDRRIGYGESIFLTAEVGCSHLGSAEKMELLLRAAAEAGCDGVDTFLWDPEEFYWDGVPGTERYDLYKKLSLQRGEWEDMHRLAVDLGIILYHTPLDPVSLELAVSLGTPMLNLNSDDMQNPIMLDLAGKTGLPVTFHDIGASLGEAEAAVNRLQQAGAQGAIVLHSTLESGDTDEAYACANLRVINTYRAAFDRIGAVVGCVEHTTSKHLIYAVAAMDPVLISKHLNVDENPDTPDASISVDVESVRDMVRKVRQVEEALGEGVNSVVVNSDGKMPAGALARRKSVVSARAIAAGELVTREHLAVKRESVPGSLHPWMLHYIVGATARENIPANTLLNLGMFRDFAAVDWRPEDIRKRRFGTAKNIV